MFLRTKPLIKSMFVSCNSRHWVIFRFLLTCLISKAGSGKSIIASTLICRFNCAKTMGTFTTAPVNKASIGTGSFTQSAKVSALTFTHFALDTLALSTGIPYPYLKSNPFLGSMAKGFPSGLIVLAAGCFKQLKL